MLSDDSTALPNLLTIQFGDGIMSVKKTCVFSSDILQSLLMYKYRWRSSPIKVRSRDNSVMK